MSEWQQTGDKRNLDDFMVLIAKVRKTGLAYDLDERTVGITFVNSRDEPHALSVPVPSSRFAEKRRNLRLA